MGGIEDIVIRNKTALLSPIGDESELAHNLLRLIEDHELRATLSKGGADYVRNKYSYHRLCADMASLYYSLL